MFLSCHKFYYFYSLSLTSLIPPHFHFTFQFLIYLLSYFFFFLSAVNCFLISNWFVLPAPASNEFASKLVLFYDYEVLTFLAIFSNPIVDIKHSLLIGLSFLVYVKQKLYCIVDEKSSVISSLVPRKLTNLVWQIFISLFLLRINLKIIRSRKATLWQE